MIVILLFVIYELSLFNFLILKCVFWKGLFKFGLDMEILICFFFILDFLIFLI